MRKSPGRMGRLLLISLAVVAAIIAAAFFFGGGFFAEVDEDLVVPQLTPAEVAGQDVFANACAACHGHYGMGVEGAGPPLIHLIYEPSHHGDQAFVRAVRNGVQAHHWGFGDMPPIRNVTDREVEQIVAYIRALQRANGIE